MNYPAKIFTGGTMHPEEASSCLSWQHFAEETCQTCMFCHDPATRMPGEELRCRANPPTHEGFPTVQPNWKCGQHQLTSEDREEAQAKFYAAMKHAAKSVDAD